MVIHNTTAGQGLPWFVPSSTSHTVLSPVGNSEMSSPGAWVWV